MGLTLHLLALFAVASFATSALAAAFALVARQWLGALHPRTRVWLALATLAAPLLVGLAMVASVLLPHQWLGMGDHCLDHPGHLHLCAVHGAPLPHLALAALTMAATLSIGIRLGLAALAAWRAARALRPIRVIARQARGLHVVPGESPVAFTVGLLSPFVVVSQTVADDPQRWRAVIAHEHAHAAAWDPLLRWLAAVMSAFHAPVLGGVLVRELHDAQELLADEEAAQSIGSRVAVAETLVAWMRWAHDSTPRGIGVGFHSGPFALRVRRLLEPAPARPTTDASTALLVCAAVALGLFVATPSLHHAVETVFGLFFS